MPKLSVSLCFPKETYQKGGRQLKNQCQNCGLLLYFPQKTPNMGGATNSKNKCQKCGLPCFPPKKKTRNKKLQTRGHHLEKNTHAKMVLFSTKNPGAPTPEEASTNATRSSSREVRISCHHFFPSSILVEMSPPFPKKNKGVSKGCQLAKPPPHADLPPTSRTTASAAAPQAPPPQRPRPAWPARPTAGCGAGAGGGGEG